MIQAARPSETPFLRLDPRAGWRRSARSEHLVGDPATGGLKLGIDGMYPISPHEPAGSFGGMTLVRGVAVTADGQVFLADQAHDRILYYQTPFGNDARPEDAPDHWPFRVLWEQPQDEVIEPATCTLPDESEAPLDPYDLAAPLDVAVSPSGDLVVADASNARMIVLTWPELRVRTVLEISGGRPAAVAFDSRGQAYVADPANRRIWRYDALWRLDHAYGARDSSGDWEADPRYPRDPRHVAIDVDDRVFVVDRGTPGVVLLDRDGLIRLGIDGKPLDGTSAGLFEGDFPPPFELSNDVLTHAQPGRPRCPSMVLEGVYVDRKGQLEGTSLRLLTRPQRIALPRNGTFLTDPLDGEAPGFHWHRVTVTAVIPEFTRLVVTTYTADERLSAPRLAELDDTDWSRPLVITGGDVPELLVQSAPGRFLWLRIELLGDGERTPSLQAIELFGPRRSSIRMLPPPFHEDAQSADFVDRMLSYFDTVYTETERRLKGFAAFLDPYAVPGGAFLDWLGSWFDWRFLADWPEATRREMIAESVQFFRQRGTVPGLRRLLQWHAGLSDPLPQIIEHFRLRDYAARRHMHGSDLPMGTLWIGGRPLEPESDRLAHAFTVVVPQSAAPDPEARAQLERLIDAQKPAHAGFRLLVLRPGIRIGCQSSVGIDMWLGEYPSEVLGAMTLGQSSTVQTDETPGLRVGRILLSD